MESSSITKAREEVNDVAVSVFVSLLLREAVGGGVGEEVRLRWFPNSLVLLFMAHVVAVQVNDVGKS